MATERSFPDSVIDEDPQKALEELNEALEGHSDNAEWFCQRAYTHLQLKLQLCCQRCQEIPAAQLLAFMRMGSDDTFRTWLKRCDDGERRIRTETRITYTTHQLSAVVKLPSGEDFSLNMNLLHPIVPQHSTFKVLSTKVEVKMQKTEGIRWEKLEGEGQEPNVKHFIPNQYPSSSASSRNWDKVVGDISEEEKEKKLEGDAALNELFQQIYCDGTDEVKRAMNKSFVDGVGWYSPEHQLDRRWEENGRDEPS
ncbi:protein SGT1 homolog isoform X2 [Salvelinus namaycush]|uniref:Protein SGT1 homolog isoform X2 n=1 Tax=Salvelinus namaycush TaxID=8040 RepID=A0A8U1C2K0_SALNM|nr:protein SGT1 homolog isoform X2 [Salvelinus namaycush]